MTPDPINASSPHGELVTGFPRFEPYRLRRGVVHIAEVRGPFAIAAPGQEPTVQPGDAVHYVLDSGTSRTIVLDPEMARVLLLLLERAAPLPTDREALAQLLAERSKLPQYAGDRWRLLLTDRAGVQHAAAAAAEHGFLDAAAAANRLLTAPPGPAGGER